MALPSFNLDKEAAVSGWQHCPRARLDRLPCQTEITTFAAIKPRLLKFIANRPTFFRQMKPQISGPLNHNADGWLARRPGKVLPHFSQPS